MRSTVTVQQPSIDEMRVSIETSGRTAALLLRILGEMCGNDTDDLHEALYDALHGAGVDYESVYGSVWSGELDLRAQEKQD